MTTGEPEPELRQAAAPSQVTLTWRHLYKLATERLGSDVDARRIVELAHETFEGTATALTDEGYLVVDGRVVSAGDVVHLRHDIGGPSS